MINKLFKYLTLVSATAFTGLMTPSASAIQLSDSVEMHGFASQGFVYSPDTPYATEDTDKGSFAFRELGLNLSWNISPQTRLTGQVLKREFGDSFDNGINLDYLLLDHQLVQANDGHFGVRIGRVKSDFGLYNASRDVPNARPGLTVPESIYFDSFRNAFLAVDGLGIYGAKNTDLGFVEFSASMGAQKVNSELLEQYIFGSQVQGSLVPDKVSVFNINLQPNAVKGLEFGVSGLFTTLNSKGSPTVTEANTQLFTELIAQGINPLLPANQLAVQQYVNSNFGKFMTNTKMDVEFYSLSAQYAFDQFVLSAEAAKLSVDASLSILSNTVKGNANLEGIYLQAEWFPRYDLETLVRYEELNLGFGFAQVDENVVLGLTKGLTFGVKWHLDQNWNIGAQVSQYDGFGWAPLYKGQGSTKTNDIWKVYRAAITYQF